MRGVGWEKEDDWKKGTRQECCGGGGGGGYGSGHWPIALLYRTSQSLAVGMRKIPRRSNRSAEFEQQRTELTDGLTDELKSEREREKENSRAREAASEDKDGRRVRNPIR